MAGTERLRIVVADDHPSVREALRALLTLESDLEVIAVARDGAEALRLARELAPDVVVLDNDMPGLSGTAVAHHLRREWRDLHIVMYTADAEVCRRAPAAGANACVVKDASPALLLDAIRGAVRPSASSWARRSLVRG